MDDRAPELTPDAGPVDGVAAPTTREQILSAAFSLFAERGFERTSLNDIAATVGIRRPSLLHHFASKEAIYQEVFRAALARWATLVEHAVSDDESEGWTKVDHILYAGFTFFRENPEFVRIVRREAIQGGDTLGFDLGEALRPFYDRAATHFRTGIADGSYRDHDPGHLLLAGYGALLSYFSDAPLIAGLIGRDPLAPEELDAHFETVRALFRSYLEPAVGSDAMPEPTTTLSESESKALLASYGVPMVAERTVSTADEARVAAVELGYPVVCKLGGDGIADKTERGLVRLSLGDEAAVHRAADELLAAARPEDGDVHILVAPMLTATRELIAGVATDPQFGRTILLGLGGILAEAVADVAIRLVPIEREDAHDMIDQLASQRLLSAFRGEPPADREALAQVLLGLSRAAEAESTLVSADCNPILLVDGRPVAVDALVERVA